jgi:Cu(I)/Ag(I) efflux system membrane protein CusA/SilA
MGILERLIDTSARKRFLVFLSTGLLLAGGIYAILQTPLDALPDLSDTQVIVFTEWMGRGPTLVEDQVTYPLVTTFLAAPKVKVVRSFTMFGMSFELATLYWTS